MNSFIFPCFMFNNSIFIMAQVIPSLIRKPRKRVILMYELVG